MFLNAFTNTLFCFGIRESRLKWGSLKFPFLSGIGNPRGSIIGNPINSSIR